VGIAALRHTQTEIQPFIQHTAQSASQSKMKTTQAKESEKTEIDNNE